MRVSKDEYELVSRDELDALRHEIDGLKEKPEHLHSSASLIEAMDRLATQMSRLVHVFEQANAELYEEYSKGYHKESEKLDKLIVQNEKIARGVLAVADLVNTSSPGYPLRRAPEAQPTQGAQPAPTPEQPPQRKQLMDSFR